MVRHTDDPGVPVARLRAAMQARSARGECMNDDNRIRINVEEELAWTPDVESDHIAVSVEDGVVTLTGSVPDIFDKQQAECAAKRIAGVRGIANDIRVQPRTGALQ